MAWQAAILGQASVLSGDWLLSHLGWLIAGAIVVVGLLGIGLSDLLRLSPKRIWAISGVCFAESIRRRVLWLTPVAIIGVIIVVQLQRPTDAQDAIRQTIKFCLFASGLLVVLATIILACTNLPKEIENRVIYTIVTKPTTRLEIIIGKVLGFARVSGAILLIMGLFTFAYLQYRAWSLREGVRQELASGRGDPLSRPTLEHYASAGLLHAKTLDGPDDLQVYGRTPTDASVRWISGAAEQSVLVPFDLSLQDLTPGANIPAGAAGLGVLVQMDYERRALTTQEAEQLIGEEASTQPAVMGPMLPSTAPAPAGERPVPPPQITVQIFNPHRVPLVGSAAINENKPLTLPPSKSGRPAETMISPASLQTLVDWLSVGTRIYVQVTAATPSADYAVSDNAVTLAVPTAAGELHRLRPATGPDGKPVPFLFRGRDGTYGQQLRGVAESEKNVPAAVYTFHDARLPDAGQVPMELRTGIERSGSEASDSDEPTRVSVQVRNLKNGQVSAPVMVQPESNRTAFFHLPASAMQGGDFEVILNCRTPGHWLGLRGPSLQIVQDNQSFAVNLLKSLLVLWLMAILVVIISIFCSTFLSWPIAVVLTLVVLLGHWGVQQVEDTAQAGIGNRIVMDMGFRNAAGAKVISESVEMLTRLLKVVGAVLPDISRFSAIDEIEQGMRIPPQRLWQALGVIGGYGLPMMVLAYMILKYKEVAP